MSDASGARSAYRRFFEGFNARDAAAFTDSLNFPHVRVSPHGEPRVLTDRAQHEQSIDFERLLESGWVRSVGARPEVLHAGRDCVHVAGGWTRYDANDRPILTNYVTYVITCVDGHWGMQSRFGVDPGPSGLDPTTPDVARKVAHEWFEALAAGDGARAASLLHRPHIIVRPGVVEAIADPSGAPPPECGALPELRVIHAGPRGVTVAAAGHGRNGERFSGVLFVAQREGRWGIVARSTCLD